MAERTDSPVSLQLIQTWNFTKCDVDISCFPTCSIVPKQHNSLQMISRKLLSTCAFSILFSVSIYSDLCICSVPEGTVFHRWHHYSPSHGDNIKKQLAAAMQLQEVRCRKYTYTRLNLTCVGDKRGAKAFADLFGETLSEEYSCQSSRGRGEHVSFSSSEIFWISSLNSSSLVIIKRNNPTNRGPAVASSSCWQVCERQSGLVPAWLGCK